MLLRSMASVSVFVKFFALAFSALLPVVNPLGSALVFLGLVGPAPDSVYRDLALKVAIRTTLFFLVVELVGTALLAFFGISLPVVQVAGGLVLAAMGWSLLNQHDAQQNPNSAAVTEAGYGSVEEKVFYPLTFPVTVDPGCIVVMLTLSAHASVKSLRENILSHSGIPAGCHRFERDRLHQLRLCPQDHRPHFAPDRARDSAYHCVRPLVHRRADLLERRPVADPDRDEILARLFLCLVMVGHDLLKPWAMTFDFLGMRMVLR
jgi:small neutral amino acid transporter SnatA (MarC family)